MNKKMNLVFGSISSAKTDPRHLPQSLPSDRELRGENQASGTPGSSQGGERSTCYSAGGSVVLRQDNGDNT